MDINTIDRTVDRLLSDEITSVYFDSVLSGLLSPSVCSADRAEDTRAITSAG